MALITCPDCGGKVSDKANACIHCGRPMNNLRERDTINKIMDAKIALKQYKDGLNSYTKETEFDIMKVNFPLFW